MLRGPGSGEPTHSALVSTWFWRTNLRLRCASKSVMRANGILISSDVLGMKERGGQDVNREQELCDGDCARLINLVGPSRRYGTCTETGPEDMAARC